MLQTQPGRCPSAGAEPRYDDGLHSKLFVRTLFFFSLAHASHVGPTAPVRLAEQKSIDDLPEEVLQHILARLPRYSDNLVARRVCRTWRAVAKDPAVVRSYFDIGDPQRANERYYSGLSQPADAGRGWLALQPSLRFDMRAILVGWLTEVHHEFRLSPKTLFLAVGFLDRLLLVRPNIARSRFQLYGLTCLWVASKFEDVTSNSIQDLVWICDDAYSRQDFEAAEQELLLVRFDLLLSSTFVCNSCVFPPSGAGMASCSSYHSVLSDGATRGAGSARAVARGTADVLFGPHAVRAVSAGLSDASRASSFSPRNCRHCAGLCPGRSANAGR